MDRSGEVEIVINARWVERALFLIIIAALAGILIWQNSQAAAETDATSLARITELETTIATQESAAATLRLRVASLEAENEDLKEQIPKTAPTTTAPAPSTPAVPVATAVLNAAWDYTGEFLPDDKYRLETVTIYITNTRVNSASVSYELCWSLLDCENAVTRDSITVPANKDSTHDVTLSIPRTVDISAPQKLKLVVREGTSILLSEEEIIR
jgi:cell division protein FtsB